MSKSNPSSLDVHVLFLRLESFQCLAAEAKAQAMVDILMCGDNASKILERLSTVIDDVVSKGNATSMFAFFVFSNWCGRRHPFDDSPFDKVFRESGIGCGNLWEGANRTTDSIFERLFKNVASHISVASCACACVCKLRSSVWLN